MFVFVFKIFCVFFGIFFVLLSVFNVVFVCVRVFVSFFARFVVSSFRIISSFFIKNVVFVVCFGVIYVGSVFVVLISVNFLLLF